MKKLFVNILVVIVIAFTSTGCFEIREEVTFKKNGSGSYVNIIDFSDLMGMMSMFMPDSLSGEMEEFDNIFEGYDLEKLAAIKGVNNIMTEEVEDYVFKFSYDFDNVNALNAAQDISTDSEMFSMLTEYKFKRKKLMRVSEMSGDSSDELSELGLEDMSEMEGMMEMFSKPVYTVIYNLPKKPKKVKSTGSLQQEEIQEERKSVVFEYDVFEFLEGKGKVFDHQVKF